MVRYRAEDLPARPSGGRRAVPALRGPRPAAAERGRRDAHQEEVAARDGDRVAEASEEQEGRRLLQEPQGGTRSLASVRVDPSINEPPFSWRIRRCRRRSRCASRPTSSPSPARRSSRVPSPKEWHRVMKRSCKSIEFRLCRSKLIECLFLGTLIKRRRDRARRPASRRSPGRRRSVTWRRR